MTTIPVLPLPPTPHSHLPNVPLPSHLSFASPSSPSSLPSSPLSPTPVLPSLNLRPRLSSSSQRRQQRERQSRIQQTFLVISSLTLIAFISLLVYFNWLMLAPHVNALFWAALWALVLDKPQQWMIGGLRWMDGKLEGNRTAIIVMFSAICIGGVVMDRSLLGLVLIGGLYGLFLYFLLADRPQLVSVVLLFLVVLIIAFPVFFFLHTAVEESREIVARTRVFIQQNPEFELLLRDFTSSSLYQHLLSYAESWGYEKKTIDEALDPATIKARLGTVISSLGEQLTGVLSGALSVVAQLGSTIFGLLTFLSFLYFLLDNRAALTSGMKSLSPLNEQESIRLGNEVKKSVSSIFLCSFTVGLLHMISTFIAFSIVGIDLCLILSFLAGFCSMLPIFSSWLVWLPAIISMLCMHRYFHATLLLLIQLFLCQYLDPLVYGRIRPGNPSLIGMSLVFGLAAFGATGVIVGPLLTTVTLTIFNIYIENISTPSSSSGGTPRGGGTGGLGLESASRRKVGIEGSLGTSSGATSGGE